MRRVLAAAVVAATLCACSAPGHPPKDWASFGDLVHDKAFISAAIHAWDHPSAPRPGGLAFPKGTGPHRGKVSVLFAGQVAFGRLAVLFGHDNHGHNRLVAVIGDNAVKGLPLSTATNVAAPDLRHLPVIAVEHDQGTAAGGRFINRDYVVVLARATTTSVRLTSRRVISNDFGLPVARAMPPRLLRIGRRSATTLFERSRPLDAMTFTGDALPDHLVVRATPAHDSDKVGLVLRSSSCFVCQ